MRFALIVGEKARHRFDLVGCRDYPPHLELDDYRTLPVCGALGRGEMIADADAGTAVAERVQP